MRERLLKPTAARLERGFSLLEIVAVVIVLLTLAGLLIPTAKEMLLSSKVRRILETVDAARQACIRFHADTDQFAIEDSGQSNDSSPSTLTRQLSTTPSALAPIPGWKGLYLRRPLTPGDNPSGGRVVVLNSFSTAPNGGFDLLGNGVLTTSIGNCILFEDLTLELAQAVDEAIDPKLQNKLPEDWGRCVFTSVGGVAKVYIYLLGEVP